MPFKHEVTDSQGKTFKRTSASRQYSHAVVIRFKEHTHSGHTWKANSVCNWASSERLAHASARRYLNSYGYDGYEIIPCVPVATGSHKQQETTT